MREAGGSFGKRFGYRHRRISHRAENQTPANRTAGGCAPDNFTLREKTRPGRRKVRLGVIRLGSPVSTCEKKNSRCHWRSREVEAFANIRKIAEK